MIDFRYHLVSLVSVFLALAVGIVLGAGPLKESIGTELTKSVDVLRQQKKDLNDKLDTANAAVSHRDDFLTGLAPTVIDGQLTGRSVVLVTLPGVDDSKVSDALVDAIKEAGGTVTGQVSVGAAWVDPAQEPTRAKVITDLTPKLPIGAIPTGGDTDEKLPRLLAEVLVGNGTTTTGEDRATSTAVLKELRSQNLIGIKGSLTGLATAALVLAPGNPDSSDQNAVPTASGSPQNAYLTLATALDAIGGGAVVSGPASAAAGSGLLAALRDDDATKEAVSTVDTGTTEMGVITAVLALREQLEGGHGAYGFVGGDTKQTPTLAAGSVVVPTATATKK